LHDPEVVWLVIIRGLANSFTKKLRVILIHVFACVTHAVTTARVSCRCVCAVIIFGMRFAFFTHISGEKTHSFKICALKNALIFDNLKEVIWEWRNSRRRIYQSSWIAWPIRLWLLWGIVLWKEILCTTWIDFILIKCICFIIKINHVGSRVKKHCFKKRIVFQHVNFLSHCFETNNYHCVCVSSKFMQMTWCHLHSINDWIITEVYLKQHIFTIQMWSLCADGSVFLLENKIPAILKTDPVNCATMYCIIM